MLIEMVEFYPLLTRKQNEINHLGDIRTLGNREKVRKPSVVSNKDINEHV